MGDLGRFEIIGALGEGGMGAVYRAFDPKLKRDVALKVVGDGAHPETGSSINLREISPEFTRRTEVLSHRLGNGMFGDIALLDEARTMARLSHPNIVTVYDVGSDGERLFIAMELVDGKNMREWLADLPSRENVFSVFRQVARGLSAAHEVGVVHRDLKPDNILVSYDNTAQIADFGLALSPEAGRKYRGGTPAYMAPEVSAGEPASTASDVYSLCVTFVEALGVNPRDTQRDPCQVLKEISSIGPRLRRVLESGLAAEPGQRPCANDLVGALAPSRSKAKVWAVTALAVVSVAGVAFLAAREATPTCDRWPELEATWSERVAATIDERIRATGTPLAFETAPRVVSNMNRRRDLFRAQREAGCDAHERNELTTQQLQIQQRCLNVELASLQAARAVLENPTAADVQRLVSVSISPDGHERCADENRAHRSDSTKASNAIRAELEAVKAEGNKSNNWAELRPRLKAALSKAEAMGDDSLIADLLYYVAREDISEKNYSEAAERLRRSAKLSEPIDSRRFAFSTMRLAR